jgi:hypothetical protein
MRISVDEKTLKFLRLEEHRALVRVFLEILENESARNMVWVRDVAKPSVERDGAITTAQAYFDFAKQLRELTASTPGQPGGLQGIS